jgi:predicted ATPase
LSSVVRFPVVPKARPPKAPPRALSPLVGRQDVLAAVEKEIDEGARVVTLTGPPGIGKTRTSLACIERLASRFPGGALFCDLTRVTSEEGLGFAVLSLRSDGAARPADDDALARVGQALATCGPMLLVLDNFEQIVFAARSVARWCEEAPELVVLVTSRERLAIAGEITIELHPLDAASAAQLFVKRARDAAGPLDPRAVDAVVRRLDGIPLAIELAAARTRIMPLAELERRLASGKPVLAQTLATAIETSWDLLGDGERRALARSSVFAGSFTLESAERVAGSVDEIAALRDKSLIHVEPEGRLGLYVSIRELAAKKLDELGAAESASARLAHARVFAESAARFNRWRQMLERTPDTSTASTIRHEKENIAAAIAWLRTQPSDREIAALHAELAIAAAALYALPAEASLAELAHAQRATGECDVALRGLVLIARHGVRSNLGEYDLAMGDLAELAALDAPSDLALLGLVDEGITLRHGGHPRDAWTKHLEARAKLERADVPRVLAMNEACMGRLAFDLGDFEASRLHNGRAIDMGDQLNDTWLGALATANLAQLEQELGRFDLAEELLAKAVDRLRNIAEVYEAVYSSACGDLYFEMGKYDLARKWFDAGSRFFRGTLMTHRHAALTWASSAALEAHAGDLELARSLIEDARRVARRASNPVVFACVELHGASVDVLGGAPNAGARWKKTIARYADPNDPSGDAVATSFEARFALRMTRRMLDGATAPAPKTIATLRVDRNGRWFDVHGERVELGRRGALRRILVALVEARFESPDRGLKQADLVAAGWPGERVLALAAATRVRVAIATLRQLGLRSHLLTRDDGYVLDTLAPLELCD